jgi:hypothetical protein
VTIVCSAAGADGRRVGRGQGCADVVAGTFFEAPCPKVGAGFQPAQAQPWAWTPRRLKTCGHFGRHPRGCRPRSGACVAFFLTPGLPSRGRVLLGQASFAVRFTQMWWLSPFSFFEAPCLKVGAGFQPAQAQPWAWTHRRLKTCGHFGRHPRGCRPRSGACVAFFLTPGLPSWGRMLLGQASFAVRFTQMWWLSLFRLQASRGERRKDRGQFLPEPVQVHPAEE